MFESSTIPHTIIKQNSDETTTGNQCKWNISRSEEKTLIIKIANIELKQLPHETVDLKLCVSTVLSDAPKIFEHQSDYCTANIFEDPHNPDGTKLLCRAYYYTYTFELQFHNYLHEFSKNYSYEIACKIPGDKYDRADKYFCYLLEPRQSDLMKTRMRISIIQKDLDDLGNMYFCIRRHNVHECRESAKKSSDIISELRSVGCDIVLEARNGRIPAYKFILSRNSDVFSRMFNHEMNEEQNGVVDMSDFDTEVVSKMLDYLYTGEVGELGNMTQSLFKLAHLYQLNDLCRLCEEYYIFNVKPNNDDIIEIMELAKLYDLNKLEKCADDFVANHEQELIQLPSYQQYLRQFVNYESVIDILLLAQKYSINYIKNGALDFIKENYDEMMNNDQFMDLFVSNPELMREVYIYKFKKE